MRVQQEHRDHGDQKRANDEGQSRGRPIAIALFFHDVCFPNLGHANLPEFFC
jgi:hypothetical protein